MELYNTNFSQKGICRLLGRERLNQQQALRLLHPEKSDKILEIGCNNGSFIQILRKYTDTVYGCDINQEVVSVVGVPGLEVMSANSLQYPDNSFNKIVSLHTIEHLTDLQGAINEMERVLVVQGRCVLIYPFELIRGLNNFLEAWRLYGNIRASRELHVNKLNPSKIEKMTKLCIERKGLFFAPYPTYFTVLTKKESC